MISIISIRKKHQLSELNSQLLILVSYHLKTLPKLNQLPRMIINYQFNNLKIKNLCTNLSVHQFNLQKRKNSTLPLARNIKLINQITSSPLHTPMKALKA